MPNCSSFFKSTLFADDSIFSVSVKNYPIQIEPIITELNKIYNWTVSNRLTINVAKTELLCFTNKPLTLDDNQIRLDRKFISFSDSSVFLGVTIDKKMSFSRTIKIVLNKLSKNTDILYKIRDDLTTQVMLNYY